MFCCADASATTYNADATANDGSCQYPPPPDSVEGCTDPSAANYNPNALADDGSCQSPPPPDVVGGCLDPGATNYDPNVTADDGSCQYPPPCPVSISPSGALATAAGGTGNFDISAGCG